MPVGDYPTYAEEAAARLERVHQTHLKNEVEKSRWRQLVDGDITVDDLDDEELMKGKVRSRNGTFQGTDPVMIPKKMHDALVRRILSRGAEKIRADFFDAIDVIGSIARDESVDPAIRLKAATTVLERVAGRTPEKVELSMEVKPWERAMDGIYRVIPPEAVDAPATKAEVVYEDQDPDIVDAEVVSET
jgi:hypothetical protein